MLRQRLYNPAQLSDAELKGTFVARHRELEDLLHLLHRQPGEGALQHALIIGPRGMGKTSLGLRFLLAVSDDLDLRGKWQPVAFPEESYGISDIAGLWLSALRHLANRTNDPAWAKQAEALEANEKDAERLAAYALDAIGDFVKRTKKKLILFVENIDDVFSQFRDKREIGRLRATLQERSDIMILGTANTVFQQISASKEPFYEFFRLFRLTGLDRNEAQAFLVGLSKCPGYTKLAEIVERDSGRIEAIRRFTDGNPRIITLAARLMVESPNGAARDDIEKLIDEQTPFFKSRIDGLSPQMRVVFNALADGWRPLLAKEVAEQTRLSSSHASAQLKQLCQIQYVEEVRIAGEKRLRYQVRERFYNIYYLLRFTRDQKEILERLIDFVAQLFGPEAITNMLSATLARVSAAEASSAETDWRTILALVPRLLRDCDATRSESQLKEILAAASKSGVSILADLSVSECFRAAEVDPRNFVQLSEAHLKFYPKDVKVLHALMLAHIALNQPEQVAVAARSVVEVDPDFETAWYVLGASLYRLGQRVEAIEAINKSLALKPDDPFSLYALGMVLVAEKELDRAISVLRRVSDIKPDFALGWLGLGEAYSRAEQGKNAEAAFRKAIDVDPSLEDAWKELVELLIRGGRAKEAQAAAEKLFKFQPNRPSYCLLLATTSIANKKVDEAVKLLEEVAAAQPDSTGTHALIVLVLAFAERWGQVGEAIRKLSSKTVGDEREVILSALTHTAVFAAAAGQSQLIVSAFEGHSLEELVKPAILALRENLGEFIEPLPAEVRNAVDSVKQKITERR